MEQEGINRFISPSSPYSSWAIENTGYQSQTWLFAWLLCPLVHMTSQPHSIRSPVAKLTYKSRDSFYCWTQNKQRHFPQFLKRDIKGCAQSADVLRVYTYTSKLLCIRLPKFPVCPAHTTVLDNQCQSYVVWTYLYTFPHDFFFLILISILHCWHT